jgi:hypothetical protein
MTPAFWGLMAAQNTDNNLMALIIIGFISTQHSINSIMILKHSLYELLWRLWHFFIALLCFMLSVLFLLLCYGLMVIVFFIVMLS